MSTGDLVLAPFRSETLDNRPSFETLMAAHQQRVLRTAYRLLGRVEDAQDVTQEVFLRLLQHLHHVDADDPKAWLYRVTVNVCNDHYRRRRPVVEAVDLADPAPGPQHALELEDRKQLLTQGLATLPERERTAVVLRDIEGLPTREVAGILGVEEVTVRSQISKARMRLADYVRTRK